MNPIMVCFNWATKTRCRNGSKDAAAQLKQMA